MLVAASGAGTANCVGDVSTIICHVPALASLLVEAASTRGADEGSDNVIAITMTPQEMATGLFIESISRDWNANR